MQQNGYPRPTRHHTAAHAGAKRDGTITLAKMQSRRADIFTTFDSNGEDTLTADELAQLDQMRAIQPREMGKDYGDGVISAPDFEA